MGKGSGGRVEVGGLPTSCIPGHCWEGDLSPHAPQSLLPVGREEHTGSVVSEG